jgi:glycosyltransferase involved in cell wall biosynthesis
MTGPIFQWSLREMGQACRQFRINLSTYRSGEKSHETRNDFKPSLVRSVRIFLEDIGRSLRTTTRAFRLSTKVNAFVAIIDPSRMQDYAYVQQKSERLRRLVRSAAGLSAETAIELDAKDLLVEFRFLHLVAPDIRQAFKKLASKRVLFCGQAYYNAWYLSRSLRSLGWKADVYNWDTNPASQIYYHGEDFRLGGNVPETLEAELGFFLMSLYAYDIVHFSNTNGISQGWRVESALVNEFGESSTIHLLKALGRKIVYSNNGCLDGVSQTSFSKWGPVSVCSICRWQNEPSVCNDERNLAWGKFRNQVADFQCTLGGNRADYNKDPRVHEVPEFYCLDPEFWHPKIEIPENYKLPNGEPQLIRLYHAVGNCEERTRGDGVNVKSSHIYLPLVERLRSEGLSLDLIEPTGIPNKEVRFLQAQADIFLEMLTFGWFGANAREAMMLGKPVICYIRPEWLEDVRREIPEYAEDLPIVSATPDTVEAVLRDLIADRLKREEIGKKSRAFAVKWHSAESGARRFDEIYTRLLNGDQQLLPLEWFAGSIVQQ